MAKQKKWGRLIKCGVLIVGVIVIPLCYSFFYLDAFWDPYSKLDTVPVAVVNEDQGAQINGEFQNLGDRMVNKLKDQKSLKWYFTDAKDAKEGMETGQKYYAVITIPSDFSKKIATAETKDKEVASITYSSNEKRNYLATQILHSATIQLEEQVRSQVTEEITGKLTDELNNVPGQLETLNDGLTQLGDGTSKLNDGLTQLGDGSKQLTDNLGTLNSGLKQAHDGTAKLQAATVQLPAMVTGAKQLNSGASALYAGLQQADAGAAQLNSGASQLGQLSSGASALYAGLQQAGQGSAQLKNGASQLGQLSSGASQLYEGLKKASAGASSLKDGTGQLTQLTDGAKALADGAKKADDGAQALKTGTASLSAGVSQYVAVVNLMNDSLKTNQYDVTNTVIALGTEYMQKAAAKEADADAYKSAMGILGGNDTVIGNVNTMADQAADPEKTQLQALAAALNTSDARNAAATFAAAGQKLNGGAASASSGASDLANGTAGLKAGSQQLSANAGQLAALQKGASDLNDALAQLTAGGAQLSAGTAQLGELQKGTAELQSALDQLTAGGAQLNAGTAQLAALQKGAADLKTALDQLTAGGAQVSEGTGTLASGTAQLTQLQSAVGQLNSALSQLSNGSGKLYSGSQTLQNGIGDAKGGSEQLNSGVQTAENTVTDKINQSREDLKATQGLGEYAGKAVSVNSEPYNAVPNYGTAFAPYFLSLSMWVGALMMLFGIYLDPGKRIKMLAKGTETRAVRVAAFYGIGLAQALALAAVLQVCLGLQVNYPAAYYFAIILGSLMFITIVQFFVVHLGDIGKFLAIIFLILQLTSCGGTFPMETVPALFNVLYRFMPMTYTVELLREVISGSNPAYAWRNAWIMIAILAGVAVLSAAFSIFEKQWRKKRAQDAAPMEKFA